MIIKRTWDVLVIVESGAPLLTSIISIMKLGHLKDSARARPQNDDDDVVASLLFQHVDSNYEGGRYLLSTGFISFRPRVTSISRPPSRLPVFDLYRKSSARHSEDSTTPHQSVVFPSSWLSRNLMSPEDFPWH